MINDVKFGSDGYREEDNPKLQEWMLKRVDKSPFDFWENKQKKVTCYARWDKKADVICRYLGIKVTNFSFSGFVCQYH